MWELREKKVSRMTPRFLAQAIGWVEVPLTKMGMGDRGIGGVGVGFGGKIGNQQFNFRLVKFEIRMKLSINMLSRQIYEWSLKS